MRTDDYRVNARVRSVFARHWVDTTKCQYATIKGKVYIRGRIRQIYGHSKIKVEEEDRAQMEKEEMNELQLIIKLEDEIKRIPDVVTVQFELENWRREKGTWKRKMT